VTKSLAEWGLSALRFEFASQDFDRATFLHDGANVDADDLFAYGDTVTIAHGATQWFVGRVRATPSTGRGNAEAKSYEVLGGWDYLARRVYQQAHKVFATPGDASSGLVDEYESLVSLPRRVQNVPLPGTGFYLAAITTGQQIKDVCDYVATQHVAQFGGSAPFTVDDSDLPDLNPPLDQRADTPASEIIRLMLRWSPEAVAWFDYSTTPPTFKCKRNTAMTTVSVALTDLVGLDIRPEPQLQVPCVAIKYRRTDTINDQPALVIVDDIHPPGATGREEDAFSSTIDLEGNTISRVNLTVAIETEDIPAAGNNAPYIAWLKQHLPWLDDAKNTDIEVISADSPTFTRKLISQSVPAWTGKVVARDTLKVTVSYKVRTDPSTANENNVLETKTRTVAIRIATTDAETTEYSIVQSASSGGGEEAPQGLAEKIYNAFASLQWSGSFSVTEGEVAGAFRIGQKLNITGGRPEWATMGAIVQAVSEDVDSGTTTVRFGPPQHLNLSDLVALMRVTRNRLTFHSTATQESGETPAGDSDLELEGDGPLENSSAGDGPTKRMAITDTATANAKIDLNATATVVSGTARPMAVRELPTCEAGVQKKRLFICSEAYV
jgi:hypothetical protein